MKKIAFLFCFVAFAKFGFSQDYSDKQNMKVVTTREAAYPKGEQELYDYIFKNVKYSEDSKNAKAEGNVMVSFNVQPDSSVTNALVLSGVGYGIDEEVTRLLKELKFEPAIRNSLPVKMNVVYTFPVRAH